MEVSIIFEKDKNRSTALIDGQLIGECEFMVSGDVWTITHTGVRPAFEGQGIARRLLMKVIEEARAGSVKIKPVCSYAARVMTGKAEYADVLQG